MNCGHASMLSPLRRGLHGGTVAMVSHRELAERKRERNARRAGREAVTVAQRVMASEEAALRRVLYRKSDRLLPSSLLEMLTDRIHRGQWDAALKLFDLLRAQKWYEPYAGMYVRLFEMLGKCKRPREAASLYDTMLADGCRPTREALTALMSAYTRNNMLRSAFDVLAAMARTPHCSPDVVTYSLMIKACCDAGDMARVSQLLSDMADRGAPANVVTYNTILDAYGKAGMLAEVEALLSTMLGGGQAGCQPDAWTLNAVIRCFGSAGRIEDMERWYSRLCAARPEEPPDSLTLHSLLAAYGGAQMLSKMQCVLRFIYRYHYPVDAVTYNILLNAYGKAGRAVQMERTFASMKASGVKPNRVTFSTLANHYGKLGLAHRLPKLLLQLHNSDVKPDTTLYNSLLDAYRRAPDLDSMHKCLADMKAKGCTPDGATFSIMIAAYDEHGLANKAEEMRTELEKLKQEASLAPLFK